MQTEPLKHGLAKLLSKYHGGYNSQNFKWCTSILSNSVQHKGTYWYCLYEGAEDEKKRGGEEVKKEVKWRRRENTRLEASCKRALSLNFDQC